MLIAGGNSDDTRYARHLRRRCRIGSGADPQLTSVVFPPSPDPAFDVKDGRMGKACRNPCRLKRDHARSHFDGGMGAGKAGVGHVCCRDRLYSGTLQGDHEFENVPAGITCTEDIVSRQDRLKIGAREADGSLVAGCYVAVSIPEGDGDGGRNIGRARRSDALDGEGRCRAGIDGDSGERSPQVCGTDIGSGYGSDTG